ncbi:MAG: ATP-binding cassette domain-containing protein, partial [Clostridia bacterium]|nr:ATP-binding cassette domain-containing protein [Clostridia bacterium]
MTVIGVSGVSLSFGEKTILENIGFSLNEGDHLGIIGVNGAGKTSLFKLIAGEYTPTSGSIYLAKERSFGYLRQEEAVTAKDPDQTLLDYMLSFFPDLCTMERAIADTEYRLSSAEAEGRTEELLTLSQKLAEQSEDFARKGGLTFRSRCQGMLLHMGFTEEEVYRKVTSLSGGQHTRLALSGLLAGEPDVLLLDEPTNHLDIDALGWFEDYLTSYRKTLLIISHDRYFLDKVTDKTLMVERGRAKLYSGNYSEAKIQKTLEDTSREKQYKEQQKEIARIRANIEFQRRCGQEHNFVTIRAKEKQLARMDLVEKVPEPPKEIGFSFQSRTTFSQETVKVKDLCFSYGSTPLIRNLSFLVKKNERVLVLGGNGTGKSTLMKLLTGKLTPDTGTVGLGEQVSVGYYDQEIHSFHEDKTVFEELRDEYPRKTNTEIRNALALFLFRGEEVDKPISVLSGGERARLTLAKLMLRPVHRLILDEPTNHLAIGS